jgi:hypothetical protein
MDELETIIDDNKIPAYDKEKAYQIGSLTEHEKKIKNIATNN